MNGYGLDAMQFMQNGQYIVNDLTYIDIFNRLKGFALNMFKWKNLPESASQRFLELQLFDKGACLLFPDPVNGSILSLPYATSNRLNMYHNPVTRQPYSIVKTYPQVSIDESVLIWNNYVRMPTFLTVHNFALRLYECMRTIDVNLNAQKTPVLITGEKEYLNTMINMYKKYEGNAPVIVGKKNLTDLASVNVFKTDAPYVADKVRIMYHDIWDEAMTFFGINNANTDKKERLITAEANANNELIKANRSIMLESRQEAADKANELWGLNLSVEFNTYIDDIERNQELEEQSIAGQEEEVDRNE